MKIRVINGPNINMLGIREVNIYGSESYEALIRLVREKCQNEDIEVECFQTNHEGRLIDYIQSCYFEHVDGIVINPAGYTHTSIAILDALKATKIPTVEVHISDVDAREEFRKISYVSLYALKTIKGEGIKGYLHAIDILKEHYENLQK